MQDGFFTLNSGLTMKDGRGGIWGSHAKGAVGLGFSKFEWSTGAVLKSRRIEHSAEPLSKR